VRVRQLITVTRQRFRDARALVRVTQLVLAAAVAAPTVVRLLTDCVEQIHR
jgi:hypothetical protein